MRRTILSATAIAFACVAEEAHADPRLASKDVTSASTSPSLLTELAPFHLKNPNEMVTFSLEDAELDELIRAIGDITGKRFVFASGRIKSFKATIFSPQKVSIAEAYQAFLSLLQANGLTVIPERDFLKIVDAQDVTREAAPIVSEGETPPPEERYMTQMQRVAHISADDAAGLLAKFQSKDGSIVPFAPDNLLILTDTGTNLRRMKRILSEIDVGGEEDRVWFEPIHYAASADVQKKLADILDLKDGAASTHGGALHVAKIVAIDRPNALAIVATDGAYARVLELVKKFDVPFGSDGEMHVVALQHSESKKLVAALNEALGGLSPATANSTAKATSAPSALGILENAVKLSAEETTNSILITATPRDFASIRNVIAALDVPRRQVFIEAVVMDLSVDTTTALSLAYHGAGSSGSSNLLGGLNPVQSLLTNGDLQGFALNVRGPEIGIPSALQSLVGTSTIPAFGALITALATSSKTDILSTPNILATDNTAAELHVQLNTPSQKNVPSLASTAAATGSTASGLSLTGLTTTTPAMLQIGPKIKITPHLNDSDEVRLDVDETISDVQDVAGGTLGTVSYLERGAKTTLTVRDQETVVIGGLVRDLASRTETKIPLLGDIPLLGALFRSTSVTNSKSNLVLVITPYIIREQEDLRRIFERKQRERQMLVDREFLFGAQHFEPAHDYHRTRGLLGAIRENAIAIEEQRKLEAMRAPRDVIEHVPQTPIELPARGAPSTTPSKPVTPTILPSAPTRPAITVER